MNYYRICKRYSGKLMSRYHQNRLLNLLTLECTSSELQNLSSSDGGTDRLFCVRKNIFRVLQSYISEILTYVDVIHRRILAIMWVVALKLPPCKTTVNHPHVFMEQLLVVVVVVVVGGSRSDINSLIVSYVLLIKIREGKHSKQKIPIVRSSDLSRRSLSLQNVPLVIYAERQQTML